jgi:threonine dehydratase
MPKNPNPAKAKAVRMLGAELVEHGAEFEEAKHFAEALAEERGMRLVSSGNEPALVTGVATAYLEIFESAPSVDTVVVPVGSGSGAAAACLVASAVAPKCRIIAVQSSASPAAHDAWRTGERVERPNHTIAEGLATGASFDIPQRIMRERLNDFVLVDDDALLAAQRTLLLDAHMLVEAAGAAAYAALTAYPDLFAGRTVALMCSGGNASAGDLRTLLSQPSSTLSPEGS